MTLSRLLLSPALHRRVAVRGLSTGSSTAASATDSPKVPIPMPAGNYPLVGHLPKLLQADGATTWASCHEECGEIFEINVMGKPMVVTNNPDHAKEILMNQGKYPFRVEQQSWTHIFEKNNWPPNIPQSHGEDWKRRRKVIGETLLQHKHAKEYVPLVVPIANRFVDCIDGHLNENGRLIQPIHMLTGMFALEAVMKVVAGVDFDALTVPIPKKAKRFAKSVETMFTETSNVQKFVPFHVYFNTKNFQALNDAWKTMRTYPEEAMKPVLDYHKKHGKLPEDSQGTVLPKLLEEHEKGNLDFEEVLSTASTAISAAVDTTGQTTEYLLYNLATNPDVQEKLHMLVNTGGNPKLDWSIEEYEEQKYLVAVVKESMRLTPTIGAHARTLQHDANLGDYATIPTGRLVLINYLQMTQNPDLYPEPHLFLPERFMKGQSAGGSDNDSSAASKCPMHADKRDAIENGSAVVNDPFAAIPFGHGGRKCAGKGFAEVDIHLAVAAILKRFRIEYDGPELQLRERQLLRPKEPIFPHLKFIPR